MSIVTADQAIARLRQDDVVAIPTETVYGLAGQIHSERALQKIFAVKQRPFFDPLIVHVADVAQARGLCAEWPALYDLLAQHFWPGPLTLIAKKTAAVHSLITSGLDTVALRCPRHPLALDILRRLGSPLAAPSANRFGRTSPTSAQHVESEFAGQVDVVDGGPCAVGIESTVLLAEKDGSLWRLAVLRPGGIPRRALREVLQAAGIEFNLTRADSERSPGHLQAHYRPPSPLVLLENKTLSADLGARAQAQLGASVNTWIELKLPDTPQEAARCLYGELRRLSATHASALWITRSAQHTGEDWEVVWDRIERAASLVL